MKIARTFTTIELDDGRKMKFNENDVKEFRNGAGESIFVVELLDMAGDPVGVLNLDEKRNFKHIYMYHDSVTDFPAWTPVISINVNNGQKIVISYDKHHTVVTRINSAGNVDSFYHITDAEFISMLNWYRYQKSHGNPELIF